MKPPKPEHFSIIPFSTSRVRSGRTAAGNPFPLPMVLIKWVHDCCMFCICTYTSSAPQNFLEFDCSSPRDETDKRFQYFITQVREFELPESCISLPTFFSQVLPSILKSAVQSVNTVVFVPSSFDFIRVQNHFRKTVGVSFTVLSESVPALPV